MRKTMAAKEQVLEAQHVLIDVRIGRACLVSRHNLTSIVVSFEIETSIRRNYAKKLFDFVFVIITRKPFVYKLPSFAKMI